MVGNHVTIGAVSPAAPESSPPQAGPGQAGAVLWWISDGKAGHRNQVRGLIEHIQGIVSSSVYQINAAGGPRMWWRLATGRFPEGDGLPDPHLILGAGHRTHLAVLAARRARGGRAVVLMKPSLPLRCFDLCLVPEHDGVRPRPNVILTRGALNAVRPSTTRLTDRGLILVGGPSAHHAWDGQLIVSQISEVLAAEPARHWRLTTSRRTPAGLVESLRSLGAANLEVIPVEQTDPEWVGRELAAASVVWVSEDSVSMIYEALTSGAAVGLLHLPRRRRRSGRVIRGLDALVKQGLAVPFDAWRQGRRLTPPSEPLAEAERCARIICERWLSGQPGSQGVGSAAHGG